MATARRTGHPNPRLRTLNLLSHQLSSIAAAAVGFGQISNFSEGPQLVRAVGRTHMAQAERDRFEHFFLMRPK
jgi:hypothetical protein